MSEKRIYVLVPQTVQVSVPDQSTTAEIGMAVESKIKSFKMVAGRLIAQGFHIGRLLGYYQSKYNMPYEEITAITLSVRNSKELRKVSDEVINILNTTATDERKSISYEEFYDTNPGFYETSEEVHTITAVGPVSREFLESALGHLDLF